MGNLLLELQGNNFINHTIFPHKLLLFDDVMVYRKRKFFRVKEVTIAYSHIVQVDLLKGIIFANMDIVNTGVDPIKLKGLPRKSAEKAKKIIDHKIHTAHAKHQTEDGGSVSFIGKSGGEVEGVKKFEKDLGRLKELLVKGKISKGEYNKKRSDLIDEM